MRGIALLQLLVPLAIAAVLLSLGGASWGPVVASVRLRVAEATTVRTLAQARLAAQSTGNTVQVCPSDEHRRCVAGPAGALAIVDDRGAALPGSAADPLPPGVLISLNRPAVAWYPWPRAASTVTVQLCSGSASESRRLIVSQVGRVRSERGEPC